MFTPKERDLERGWPGRIDGDRVIQLAAQTLEAFFSGGGKAREHDVYRLSEVRLRPPVLHPPSVRSFSRGLDFHFSNPASIYGPEDEIPYPEGSEELDYEVGGAAIIGAGETIGGFTVVNDWAARDLHGAKSKDFATSLGPVVVTPDEYDGTSGDIVARVNGEERWRGSLAPPGSWEELRSYAARNTRLVPGDVLSFAIVRGGPVHRGDVVDLEASELGILRNTIGRRGS
jgi:2-keto-4-pentenoate hydratase/2-oxohepta-3-ene-1,7-dioic acid hydratase in catechol pathway